MWVDGEQFGIKFDSPIEESELLIHIAPPSRNEEPAPDPNAPPAGYRSGFGRSALTPEQRKLAEEWFSGSDRSHDIGD
jgi:hypothetical protein